MSGIDNYLDHSRIWIPYTCAANDKIIKYIVAKYFEQNILDGVKSFLHVAIASLEDVAD
jgi:hypothetical protein